MMRLAYVCADPGVPVFGRKGASVHVQEVLRALSQREVEIVLFAARLGGERPPDLTGLHVIALPEVSAQDAAERERRLLEVNSDIARHLDEVGHLDAVYERHSLWSFAGMEWAHRAGVPGLLEVNSPLLVEQAEYRALHDVHVARRAVERAYAAAGAILAVSAGVAGYLAAFAPGLGGKTHVVPNGVDPSRFVDRSSPRTHAQRNEGFTVGFVGTLKPWHGVDTLIEAFACVRANDPAARLLIVGDGPERASLEALADRLGISGSVEFTGAVAPADVPAQIARMDVAAAPYPALKGFYFSPLKLFEYMAGGCAVVASAIGQIAEVIANEETGLLYPPGDVAELAEAIERLRTDLPLRERLVSRARRQVLECHTWSRVAERILLLIDGVRVHPGAQEVTVQ